MSHDHFEQDIVRFNEIYKLENNHQPTLLAPGRLQQFYEILSEEVEEVQDIRSQYEAALAKGAVGPEESMAILTDMADWLGDIVVYCASEARRWGIPLNKVLKVIMESNFSKLDQDGQPIYDHRGKVMKGPNYWKPEGKIAEVLRQDVTL